MFTKEEQVIIKQAKAILRSKLNTNPAFTSPDAVKDYFQLRIGSLEHEVFAVMFLNNKNRLIAFKELFRGTIDGASVYPREVAKEALKRNAASVIFSHNHPSGWSEASNADIIITRKLRDALGLLDITVLDHIIVTWGGAISFAERGLL